MRRIAVAIALSGFVVAALPTPGHAIQYQDTYWGGTNSGPVTANSQGTTVCCGWNKDIVGDPAVFDVLSVDVQRTTTSVKNDTLQVIVNTNYAGQAGIGEAAGTGYGSLFFSTAGFAPQGNGPTFDTDVYRTGRYDYVAAIGPQGNGGSANLYSVDETKIVMSNVFGQPHNSGYIFRQGQAVQYDPGNQAVAASGSYTVTPNSALTFTIQDNGLLGNTFMLMWAMTCGNDIIIAQVNMPSGGNDPVPLPAALPLLAGGLGILGFIARRRASAAAGA